MDGKDLFEKHIDSGGDYAQELLTIFSNIGDDIYPLMETAEAEGKKLSIDETTLPEMWDSFDKESVILV